MILGIISGAILIIMYLYLILEEWGKMGIANKLIILIMLVGYMLAEVYLISQHVINEFFNCIIP